MADEKDNEELETEFEEELLEQGLKYITPEKFVSIVQSTVSNVVGTCTEMSWFGENYIELKIGKDMLIFPTKTIKMSRDQKGISTFTVEAVPKTELRKKIRQFYSELIDEEVEKKVKQRLKTIEK